MERDGDNTNDKLIRDIWSNAAVKARSLNSGQGQRKRPFNGQASLNRAYA